MDGALVRERLAYQRSPAGEESRPLGAAFGGARWSSRAMALGQGSRRSRGKRARRRTRARCGAGVQESARKRMRQVILDTETTGLEVQRGHRVIEIGCVELVQRRPTGRTFHHYLNPDRAIDEGARAVTGISDEFLLDKPRFIEVAAAFLEFNDGAEVIAHNASFDIG